MHRIATAPAWIPGTRGIAPPAIAPRLTWRGPPPTLDAEGWCRAEGLAEAGIRHARHDRAGRPPARRHARARSRDRRPPADPRAVPRAATGSAIESRSGGELPGRGRRLPALPAARGDHGRGDRRRDRRPDLPDVLPRAVGPHVLPGHAVWPARVLGRRCEGRPGRVRPDDGGGPGGPPPKDDTGARPREPRAAAHAPLGSGDVGLPEDPHHLGAADRAGALSCATPVLEGDDRPLERALRLALHAICLVLRHAFLLPPQPTPKPPRWAASSTMVAPSTYLCKHPWARPSWAGSRTMASPLALNTAQGARGRRR